MKTKVVEAKVSGASTEDEAAAAAQSIVESLILRAAISAGEPSWPMVLSAAGRAQLKVDVTKAKVRFAGEIVYENGQPTGETLSVTHDQGPRDSTIEGLAKLRPVLPNGNHTAGNSSQISTPGTFVGIGR